MRVVISEFMSLDGIVQAPDDAVGAVAELRKREGGDLHLMGSPSFAAQLIGVGLVDEYRLMIEPVVLGGGKRLFPDDGTLQPLQLVAHVLSGTGVQICTYQPAPK